MHFIIIRRQQNTFDRRSNGDGKSNTVIAQIELGIITADENVTQNPQWIADGRKSTKTKSLIVLRNLKKAYVPYFCYVKLANLF